MVNWPQYGGTSARSLLLMRRSWPACLADGVPDCAAAATLLDIVTEAKRYQGKAQIAHINRADQFAHTADAGRVGWRA